MTPGRHVPLPMLHPATARDAMTETEIDPVCGMTVDPEDKPDLHLEVDGRTYWFCGRGCFLDFKDDPARYLDKGYTPGGM